MRRFSSISETRFRRRLLTALQDRRLRAQIALDIARGIDEYILYGGLTFPEFQAFHAANRAWKNRWYTTR
jgi:hypothetical protein